MSDSFQPTSSKLFAIWTSDNPLFWDWFIYFLIGLIFLDGLYATTSKKITTGKKRMYIGLNFGLYDAKPVIFIPGTTTKIADIRVINAINENIKVSKWSSSIDYVCRFII
mgnify:FL=1